jgi:hypothetical protein
VLGNKHLFYLYIVWSEPSEITLLYRNLFPKAFQMLLGSKPPHHSAQRTRIARDFNV